MYKYKTIIIKSEKDLKKAEWYKSHGWKIISSGFNSIQFEKEVK